MYTYKLNLQGRGYRTIQLVVDDHVRGLYKSIKTQHVEDYNTFSFITMSAAKIAIFALLVSRSSAVVAASQPNEIILYAIADDDQNVLIRPAEDGRFVGKVRYTRSINATG